MTLAETLAAHGHSLATLRTRTEALILFGSRTTDFARPDSDWDLLVIGRGQTTLARGLDLVVIPPAEFDSPSWRTSELAGHVARFGQTLAGSPRWLASLTPTRASPAAIEHKREVIVAQLRACERYWPTLGPWARTKRLVRIRRDLQRHARLVAGSFVPPTAILDAEWSPDTIPGLLASFDHPFTAQLAHELTHTPPQPPAPAYPPPAAAASARSA